VLGIVTVAVKVPVDVVIMLAGLVVTVLPSNFIVTGVLAGKFEPVTVTVEPVAPLDGFSVTVSPDPCTVNWAAPIFPVPSEAVTV
jgi:hypothetical protein